MIKDVPAEQEIHVILDNYCTHKKNHDWLAKHPNVHFRFTPQLSQLAQPSGNLVRYLLPKNPQRSRFVRTGQLVQAIEAFIAASASPFVWRKREVEGEQLRNTIANLYN